MINLTNMDTIAIKAAPFATEMADTYLTIFMGAIYDLAANANPIDTLNTGVQVLNYTADQSPPELIAFHLDLELDELSLAFNEPVRTSTFMFTGVTIMSNCSGGSQYTLTGGEFQPPDVRDGVTQIVVSISPEDLIAIKSDVMLATDSANTYIRLDNRTVEDVALNSILAVDCLGTIVITPDTVRLQLLSFDTTCTLVF